MTFESVPAPAAAFFDIDGTVIHGITIAEFFRFVTDELDDPELADRLRRFELVAATYSNRERLTRVFFQMLTDQSWSQMLAWGRDWYASVGRTQLVPELVDRIGEHRERGEKIVFVSGSWLPCLLPIAEDLRADRIYCCELVVEADELTGEATLIPIGETKAQLVRGFALRNDLDLANCFAYGDDASDTPMLAAVGRPVAVNPTPTLAATATEHGWEILMPRSPVVAAEVRQPSWRAR